jgi:uncharacterized protein YaiI (UPF0178 family)
VLINRVKTGDIVVTQDYGLAALVLGKSAKALNQNGLIYSNDNMDRLLMERHIGQRYAGAGGEPKARLSAHTRMMSVLQKRSGRSYSNINMK